MKKIEKVIRDGKVAVLISGGFGAGWYTWNSGCEQCLFSPEIVKMVEAGRASEITDQLCEKLFGVKSFYSGGKDGLHIEWLPEGTAFEIEEYDGAESLRTLDSLTLLS